MPLGHPRSGSTPPRLVPGHSKQLDRRKGNGMTSKERSVGDDRSRLEDIKRQNDAAIRSADAVDKRLAEAPARAKRLADRARREIEKVVHNQNGNGKRHH